MHSTIPAGTRLGPYEIQSLLGAGGMGEVYRARDSRLQRDVAIKVLPQAFAESRTYVVEGLFPIPSHQASPLL
jgi:serine/threonine protein kinase